MNGSSHVFGNLIGNALAHSEKGGEITLSAGLMNGNVRFSLKDTGEGIASQHLSHVFDRFYRTPNSRSKTGVGLGLAIAKVIVVARRRNDRRHESGGGRNDLLLRDTGKS